MRRFEVYLVRLDPTQGYESKTRPCAIVSPDSMNQVLRTVIIAPMTTTKKVWPSRVAVKFGPVESYVALDQMRSVDKARLLRRRGALRKPDAQKVCDKLVEIFTL